MIDTTVLGPDVTGRVEWTQRGAAGRKVTVFRDRLARDTTVKDSAPGSSPIITKTLYHDAARSVTVIDGNNQSIQFLHDVRGRLVRQTDPASAKDTFAYDANDRLIKWKTRRGDSLTYAYDGLSRLRTKTLSGTGGGTWTYGYHHSYGTSTSSPV